MSKRSRIGSVGFGLLLAAALAILSLPTRAADLIKTWQGPESPVAVGTEARLTLNVLNLAMSSADWSFPPRVMAQIRCNSQTLPVTLKLSESAPPGKIASRGFVCAQYAVELPRICEGEAVLFAQDFPGSAVMLTIQSAPISQVAVTKATTTTKPADHEEAESSNWKTADFDPIDYFKRHLFPHEPFYFLAGPDSPNAKFQFSFKYQLVDDRSGFAESVSLVTNFFFGFTQTSLWDWNKPSAPFEDSSYKPELMFQFSRLAHAGADDWFRLDLQTGGMHESNGRDGANSRSLNLAYLRPKVMFGHEEDWQFTLASRLWFYMGDLSDNPDIARYRGYADLRATIGTPWGVELAVLSRVGDEFDRANLQLDLTIPFRRIRWTGFTWYFQAQYFTGYGESLLHYNERSDAWRVGFGIYR